MKGLGVAVWVIIALGLPLLELISIYQMWQWMGAWTLAWLLLAVIAGLSLVASERQRFLPRLLQCSQRGQPPWPVIKASGLRFLAGILLVIPGLGSDVSAVLLLLFSLLRGPAPAPETRRRAANDDVIEGECRRVE
jgi:UPF0716 protein FxsA